MKKTLLSMAVTAIIGLAGASAHAAFLPATIDETQLGAGTHITTNVGKLNGGYLEQLTVNDDFTFSSTAFATFSQLFTVNGQTISQLTGSNKTGLGGQYSIYAIFNSSGYVSSPTSFSGLVGSFQLYLDLNGDSEGVFGSSAATSATASNTSDDILLASSSTLTSALGQGVGSPTSSFIFLFDNLSLTADGAQGDKYFVSPDPFYAVVDVNGDFDDGLVATTPGTYSGITGDVSANFQVPEPGSLALLGLGLAGLGLVKRRRTLVK